MIKHFRIRGVVQGVCYRASTQDKATELGLQGWVRNCSDGSVEALASGDVALLESLEQWLHQGPTYAKVDTVETREITNADADYASLSTMKSGFHIAY